MLNKNFRNLIFCIGLFFTNLVLAGADTIDLSNVITDHAQVLESSEILKLTNQVKAILNSKNTLINIVVDSENFNGTAEQFSKQLFLEKKLDTINSGRTALIFISIAKHQLHLELGPSMKKRFPDLLRKEVLDSILLPAVSKRNFFGGIDKALALLASENGLLTAPDFRVSVLETFLLLNVLISLIFVPIVFKFVMRRKNFNEVNSEKKSFVMTLATWMDLETPGKFCLRLFLIWISFVIVLFLSPIFGEISSKILVALLYISSILYFSRSIREPQN